MVLPRTKETYEFINEKSPSLFGVGKETFLLFNSDCHENIGVLSYIVTEIK